MKHGKIILAIFLIAFARTFSADASEFKAFEYAQAGDLDYDCHRISKEISAMENLILDTRKIQESSDRTETGVMVAKTVGSYLVGSLAGGIGIMAAGYLLTEATDNKAENARILQDAAEQRRSFMAGIYNARGCNGPLELAAIEPAAGSDDESREINPAFQKPRYNE